MLEYCQVLVNNPTSPLKVLPVRDDQWHTKGKVMEKLQFINVYEYGYGVTKEVVFLARHFRHNVANNVKSKGVVVFSGRDGKKSIELFEYESRDGTYYQDRIVREEDGSESLITGAECWKMGLSDDAATKIPELVSTIVA